MRYGTSKHYYQWLPFIVLNNLTTFTVFILKLLTELWFTFVGCTRVGGKFGNGKQKPEKKFVIKRKKEKNNFRDRAAHYEK